MANVFDENWDKCFAAEDSAFGEEITIGGITCNAQILEFSRIDGTSPAGGRNSVIGGRLVMARAKWDEVAAGKSSQRAVVRNFPCRISQKPTDSLGVSSVTLEIVAESGM